MAHPSADPRRGIELLMTYRLVGAGAFRKRAREAATTATPDQIADMLSGLAILAETGLIAAALTEGVTTEEQLRRWGIRAAHLGSPGGPLASSE